MDLRLDSTPVHSDAMIDSYHEKHHANEPEYHSHATAWPGCADDSVEARTPRNRTVFSIRKPHATSGVSALFFASALIGLFVITFSRSYLQNVDEEVSVLFSNHEQSDLQVQGLEQDIRLLNSQLLSLDAMIRKEGHYHQQAAAALRTQEPEQYNDQQNNNNSQVIPSNNNSDDISTLQNNLKTLTANAENLKALLQEESRKEVEQKYGSGIHHVEIQLEFPDGEEGPDTFVIELAPMELMPHSVHFFLDTVSTGLLDGYSFILSALHVLKAAPIPYDGSSVGEKARTITENDLESVAFREYNENYPHKLYTVGFALDGSPSFYINTEDNSEIRVGEPCFGTIIEGFDAIHRLEKSPTRNGFWFEQRIGIKHATILSTHYDATSQQQ